MKKGKEMGDIGLFPSLHKESEEVRKKTYGNKAHFRKSTTSVFILPI